MKYLIPLGLALLLFLSACGGAASEPTDTPPPAEAESSSVETESNTSEETPTSKAASNTDTAEPETGTQTEAPTAEDETPSENSPETASASGASCRAESITSLIDLQMADGIAAVDDSAEWQHGGGAESLVTIVEYGDFQ